MLHRQIRSIGKAQKFGDFSIHDVIEALEKGKKYLKNGTFRILLKYEDDPEPYWCAICLEMNVVATGDSEINAIENVIALMSFHVMNFIEDGIEHDIFITAGPEVWSGFMSSPERIPKSNLPDFSMFKRKQPRITARRALGNGRACATA